MKLSKKIVLSLILSLLCVAGFSVGVMAAGVPVIDKGTLVQTMVNNVKVMLEVPHFTNVMNLSGHINSTIGTAKSNFSNLLNKGEHNGDGNAENGEYDQDYDHIPDNKIPGPEDALMNPDDLMSDENGKYKGVDASASGNGADRILYASASVSGSYSMALAKKDKKKYKYLGSLKTDDGKRYVFPDELADYCEITVKNVDTIKKKVKFIECQKQLLRFRQSPNQDDQRKARDIYFLAFYQGAYANTSEALITRNFAVHYEKEILKPMTKKAAKAKEERDDFAVLMSANKEIARLLNRLYNVYAMRVTYDTLRDYGDFELYPEEIKKKPEDPNPKGSIDGVFIFPKELADYCGIDVKDIAELKNKSKMVGCLKSLIEFRRSEDQSAKREARDIYVRALQQANMASSSEALIDRIYSLKYEKEILDEIESLAIESKTEKVDLDAVIKANTEIANMLSRVMNVSSMRIAYDNLRDLGDYEIYPDELLEIE